MIVDFNAIDGNKMYQFVCSLNFVHSFFLGRSLLWTPARAPWAGPMRLPLGERREIGWYVQCVCDVQERWVK